MKIISLFVIISLFFVSSCANENESKGKKNDEMILAFIPSRNVNVVQRNADKIAAEISKLTGFKIKAKTFVNYSAVVVALRRGDIDIAFLGPLSFVKAREISQIQPITASIRKGVAGYHGVIITKKSAEVNQLEDLKGKSIAFADALSTSGYLYPRHALKAVNIDPDKDITSLTIASHATIVLSVLTDKVFAGATYLGATDNPEVLDKFPGANTETKVVWKSTLIPPDVQVVRSSLGSEKILKIKKAFLDVSDNPSSKQWLEEVYAIDRLVPISKDILESFDVLIEIANNSKKKGK